MTDKATRDKIASARVGIHDLAYEGRSARDHIARFGKLAEQCLREILAALPADLDPATRAVLVRLRLEIANNSVSIETIDAFLSVYESLRDAMPPFPPRSRAAVKRARDKNFQRTYGLRTP